MEASTKVELVKVASAWTFAGITWSELAAILAAVYTFLLITEHIYKRWWVRFRDRNKIIPIAEEE